MLYPSMKDLLKNIDNRYLLVNITAQRARQIADRADNLGERLDEKAVKIAINEIAEGRLMGNLKHGQESASRR